MARPAKPWVWWMLFVFGAVLTGVLLLFYLPVETNSHLDIARRQWGMRAFSGYRLVIEETAINCRQDVGVQNEVVTRLFSDTCRTVPWTVTGLFTIAERNHSTRYQCVDLGCACDTVMTAHVVYDAQNGYPTRLDFHWTTALNVRHPDFWRTLIAKRAIPTCRALNYNKTIQVVSLTPVR